MTKVVFQGKLQNMQIYKLGGCWRTTEAVVIFRRRSRNIAEAIMIRKYKDTRGSIMIPVEASLWSSIVPMN